jgi:predicted dehydrogenase
MSSKTRIAVIGLGGVAQLVHIPILKKEKNVEISAVSEINKSRLNSVAEKFGIKNKFTDYREMLDKSEYDAVIISTPTNTHYEIALESIQKSPYILLEKPFTRSYSEAKEVHEKAKKAKCNLMVGMNMRFRPDAMLLKSLLNSGELGEVFYLRCGWLRKQSSKEKWFLQKKQSGGGVIIDLGIALIDLACWLLGNPKIENVSVQTYNHQTKSVEDSAVGLIRFKNSALLNFEISWSLHSEHDSMNFTAFGTEGTAHLNPLRAYKRIGSTRIDFTTSRSGDARQLFKKSYENELKHFISAVRGNNPILSSSDEALYRMKLLELLYLSAEKSSQITPK